MARDQQAAGACLQCGSGTIRCSYNHFVRDELEIHTWEHRCLDCSVRETTAFRSDDEPEERPAEPRVCPYCGRAAGA